MKKYIGFLIIICICSAFSEQEQDLIVSSKNKKKYVSEQQCAELGGQMIITTNESSEVVAGLQGLLVQVQQIGNAVQKKMLSTLNDYIDGEKECFLKKANKVQRTDCYEKLTKLQNTIESYTQKMRKMQQQIDIMRADLQQQFADIVDCYRECL